jgi:hypothetical protein
MERATRGSEEDVANHLHGLLRKGLELAGSEVLVAPKAKGLRPLTALSFSERVVYRALTQSLKTDLQLPDRSYPNYLAFSQAPLEMLDTKYVLRADIAAFYQYVDHDILHEEIVNRTGHAGAADSIAELLHGFGQKRIGLPQLYDPSDWLSEIVIDRVERATIRAGYQVTRFNDDFRVASPDWGTANRAMLYLDSELRSLGFVFNDEKTFIQSIDSYRVWVNAPENVWRRVTEELRLDIREPDWEAISDYARVISPLVGEEVEESDEDDVTAEDPELRQLWITAAERGLEIWLSGMADPNRSGLRESIDRRLLRQALKVLTAARGFEGLEHCKTVLTTEQHLSHVVGRYLKSVATKNPDAVVERLETWIRDGFYLSEWQKLWLLEPLAAIGNLSEPLGDWVMLLAGSSSNVVRGRALAILVSAGLVTPQAAAAELPSLPDMVSKDVVAAIAKVEEGEGRLVRALKNEDFLTKLVVEYQTV